MKKAKQFMLWSGSLALAIVYLAGIWACDFDFNVSVDGKGVKGSAIGGAADKIEAQIKVGGKKCKAKQSITLTVGDDGCVRITGQICGQQINAKICGLKPGSRFQYDLEVDGGGMVAVQVPASFTLLDAPSYLSTSGTDSTKVVWSDSPFGWSLKNPFLTQSGKKVVYARWEPGFNDSSIDGVITMNFKPTMNGLDTIKFVLLGELHFFLPGTATPAPIGADSVVLFAEAPKTYDFSMVTAPAAIPLHIVAGPWLLLTDAQATAGGLPNVATTNYIDFSPNGATASQLNTSYTLSANGNSVNGTYYGTVTVPAPGVVIAFAKSDVEGLTDTLKHTLDVTLSGSVKTTTFPTTFDLTQTLQGQAGVDQFVQQVPRFSIVPDPARDRAAVFYSLSSGGKVTILLVDEAGKVVRQLANDYESAGNHDIEIDLQGLPESAYFVKFEMLANGMEPVSHTEKLVLQR